MLWVDLPGKKSGKKSERTKAKAVKKKLEPKRNIVRKGYSKKKKKKESPFTSSYESWLSSQVSERMKHPRSETLVSPHLQPPADTFDSWLRNQPVVEKESNVSTTVTVRTYDDWMNKQVAERKLRPDEVKEEKTVEESQTSNATVSPVSA